jgi:hypothetical protein
MAQSFISLFVDDAATAAMAARVPAAVYNSGVFAGGGNAPGIGISTENPNLEQSLPEWTLLDQHGNARAAQIGQVLGGDGITPEVDYPSSGGQEGTLPDATIRLIDPAALPTYADKLADPNLDGNVSFPALGANLTDLAVGWETGL